MANCIELDEIVSLKEQVDMDLCCCLWKPVSTNVYVNMVV